MPISVDWYDKAQTTVLLEMRASWTREELSAAIRECRYLLNSVDHTVDVIWDASNTHTMPKNIISNFTFPSEDAFIPKNQGVVVVVVKSPYLKTFALLAKRMLFRLTRNMDIVESLAEAELKIESLRGRELQFAS